MRARGFINTAIQKPFSIYGMPPKLFMLAMVFTLLFYLICSLLDFRATAFIGSIAIFAVLAVWLFIKNSKDCHFEYVFFNGRSFWKGKKTRHLIAGWPTDGSKK